MISVLVIAIGSTGATVSERVTERDSTASGGQARLVGTRSETCRSAKRGLRWYSKRANEHRLKMGVATSKGAALGTASRDLRKTALGCPRIRRAAEIARWKAYVARYHAERFLERMHDPAKAICHVFGAYCQQALSVARCESGRSMTPRAHNGQYLGAFQMGSYARAAYGHGDTVLEQAQAAWRYFVASGKTWRAWSCKP